jgi:hypothetical protein
MAQDDETKSPLSGLLGPTFVLAVLSAVGYLSYQPALKSARPRLGSTKLVPLPPSPPGLKPVHARLWDDPLAVAYRDSQRRQRSSQVSSAGPSAEVLCASDSRELQREIGSVVTLLLGSRREDDPQPDKRFLVMPVLVPGEPYEDDTERRKRTTYALLSALGVSGFHLKYADRLTYVEVPICVVDRITDSQLSTTLAVPIKLFVPDDDPSAAAAHDVAWQPYGGVIVCWINQAQLGSRPLSVVHQILRTMFDGIPQETRRARLDLRIVGPADSDMLLDIAVEDSEISLRDETKLPEARAAALPKTLDAFRAILSFLGCAGQPPRTCGRLCQDPERARPLAGNQFADDFHEPHLISPMATVPERDFPIKHAAWMRGGRSNSGLKVVRAIGTDDLLAVAVAHELTLRDAWPRTATDGKSVVLVTENDTHYGRSIARAFRRAMEDSAGGRHRVSSDALQVFTYIQGIDGKLEDPKDEDQGRSADKPDPSQVEPLHAPPPEALPASGRSQYDYLRRLQDHLRGIHDEQRSAGKPGITAIGVVGTDVYDKLLVLRALRKQFPRAWFFTTDLDAELYRGDEYATTRNLLIASHFGLELNATLQRSAPPFRDSYQTAVFLATLHCVDDKPAEQALRGVADTNYWLSESGENRALEPLVFELGRSGPYQLTVTGKAACLSAKVHPRSPRESGWLSPGRALALALGAVAVLALLAIHSSWLRGFLGNGSFLGFVGRAAVAVGLLLTLAMAVEWANRQPDGEPFLVFEGISLWTPILIRCLAATGGIFLMCTAIRKIDLPATIGLVELPPNEAQVDSHLPGETGCRSLLTGVRRSFRAVSTWLRKPACGKQRASPFAVWHDSFRNRKSATALIHAYRKQGRCWRRAVRTLVITLAIVLGAAALFRLATQPLQPYRGTLCWAFSNLAISAAVVVLALLTGFVVDALWLCRLLIRQLGSADADLTAWKFGKYDPRAHVATVRFIGALTHSAGGLTWHPLIVVFLMILARSKVFDLIDFSWPLILLWLVIGFGVIFVTWNLRHAADGAREAILGRLRDERLGLCPDAPARGSDKTLDEVIEEIEREGSGAFRPFTQDPLFKALLALLGGSGGVLLLDQLIPYM